MKLLLIKIGKAWHTLRREGLARGGRRVIKGFFALFGRVGSGDILFITGGIGDSARYRCHHVAEELRLKGFSASVTVQDNPLLPGYADKFSIFIFHRVLFTPSVAKLIERIKSAGKEIIFETDDLVYDPHFLQFMDYYQKMNPLERKLYENGVGGEILRDPYVKVCTTTTSYLAGKLHEHGKRVLLVPNRLSQKDVAIAEQIVAERSKNVPKEEKQTISIAYFSGTQSHNKDFSVVTPAILSILERHPKAHLVLAGPLDADDALQRFAERITVLAFAPWEQHLRNIAAVDINLAPLEMDNPFCESKSELKFYEAGLLKVPTVASATQTYRESIEDGVDGFTAATTEEWEEKLTRLIEDAELRRGIGEKAYEKTIARYTTTQADNQEYYDFLRSRL